MEKLCSFCLTSLYTLQHGNIILHLLAKMYDKKNAS